MLDFEAWLSWQAEVTDAIDREEMELRTYKTMEKLLLVRRDRAEQLERVIEVQEIDTQLFQVRMMQRLKALLIKRWQTEFHQTARTLFSS